MTFVHRRRNGNKSWTQMYWLLLVFLIDFDWNTVALQHCVGFLLVQQSESAVMTIIMLPLFWPPSHLSPQYGVPVLYRRLSLVLSVSCIVVCNGQSQSPTSPTFPSIRGVHKFVLRTSVSVSVWQMSICTIFLDSICADSFAISSSSTHIMLLFIK